MAEKLDEQQEVAGMGYASAHDVRRPAGYPDEAFLWFLKWGLLSAICLPFVVGMIWVVLVLFLA